MDQAAFKLSFPAFPADGESIEKLGRLLINEGVVTSQIWQETRSKMPTPPLSFRQSPPLRSHPSCSPVKAKF